MEQAKPWTKVIDSAPAQLVMPGRSAPVAPIPDLVFRRDDSLGYMTYIAEVTNRDLKTPTDETPKPVAV